MQVVAGVLGRAGEAGQKQRLNAAAKGGITYRPARGLKVPGGEDEKDGASKLASDKQQDSAFSDDLVDTNEVASKMDEVNNREDHRVKGGRELKASA